MEEGDDPYEILGVGHDAAPQQIKTAYRKAALKHHPDKQGTEQDRQRAHIQFAKISNAYEILSDPNQRKAYDLQQQQQQSTPFHGTADDFAGYGSAHFRHGVFHDPFELFAQTFREEFGGVNNDRHGGSFPEHRPFGLFGSAFPSMFHNDPFFGSPLNRRPSQPQQQQQQQRGYMDPFGRRGFGGVFDDPFFGGGGFGGGGEDIFSSMRRMQEEMQRAAEGGAANANNNNGRQSSFVYSSTSTSSFGGGNNGESVSTSTTTRMINGKRQTVTEKVVRKADGTVERHVETTGDDDFPTNHARYLQGEQQEQPRELPAAVPPPRRFLSWGRGDKNKDNRRNSKNNQQQDVVETENEEQDPVNVQKRSSRHPKRKRTTTTTTSNKERN